MKPRSHSHGRSKSRLLFMVQFFQKSSGYQHEGISMGTLHNIRHFAVESFRYQKPLSPGFNFETIIPTASSISLLPQTLSLPLLTHSPRRAPRLAPPNPT